jgi:predicted nucleic acid-binding protein
LIIIADTGPINYLILIGEIGLLPALYDCVIVPPSVCQELGRVRAPEAVRAWIAQPPSWLGIVAPTNSPDAGLAHLDAGERDAILLAEELAADQIVIDEIRGRREARRRELHFTGTLGVLAAGAEQGLVDLRIAVDHLRQTNFYISAVILDRLVDGK